MLATFAVVILSLIAFPPQHASDYALSDHDKQIVRAAFSSERFPTASEAAYAASLRYGRPLQTVEVGAKIYVDLVQGAYVYSYGPPIYGEAEDESNDEVIEYDPRAFDGHFFLVGFWHEHPSADSWLSLYGHYSQIALTHQAVWTSIGRELFVQYWDGTQVMPRWTSAVPAIAPIVAG